jgi:hypothetical protein
MFPVVGGFDNRHEFSHHSLDAYIVPGSRWKGIGVGYPPAQNHYNSAYNNRQTVG